MTGSRRIERAIQLYLRHSGLALVIGLAAAVGCTVLTATWLEFKTNRQDLLNPASEFHNRWLSYVDEFGGGADAVVVIEGPTPDQVIAVSEEFGAALRSVPSLFCDVLDRFEADALSAKGLYYLPDSLLAQLERFADHAVPRLNNPHVQGDELVQLSAAMTALGSALPPDPQLDATSPPLFRHGESTDTGGTWSNQLRDRFSGYLLAQDGRLGLVLTRLVPRQSGFVPSDEPFRKLEEIARRLELKHPGIRIGLTGLPVLERDEMKTSRQDMSWASVLSIVAVTVMIWAGFGGLKYPLLGTTVLLAGIAWTCGYVTLVVGHLNILSISFGVILIGLGIDFSIHYLARYLHGRENSLCTEAALMQALRHTGRPILSGGVTTAAAFFATSLTEFRGVAELGVIAGGGILLCAAATLLLLPCAIKLVDRHAFSPSSANLPPMEKTLRPFWNRPWRTISAFAVVTVVLLAGCWQLKYDQNLLNLQASGLPSVYWERRLLDQADRNAMFAVSVADSLDQVRERREAFQHLETVGHVEELASLLPRVSPDKQARVRRIRERLSQLDDTPPVLHAISTTAAEVDAQRTLSAYRLWHALHELKSVSDPRPPQLDDVPASVRHRLVGRTGKHLIRIYARDNVWQPQPLKRFVRQLEQVDRRVTGDPVQTYYATDQMSSSYLRAAGLAALAVVAIMMVDFRHPGNALLAALPMSLGLVQLLGLMGWLQIPLNAANIIVLPLIIGIGVDDGIHVVHERRRIGESLSLSRASVTGVVLTSLTSMIGFGSLMLAQHEGLRSLGRVATLGIGCCWVTSLVLLPCLLVVVNRRASRPAANVVT
jgi:predicted RND superfamily exporter protein